MKNTALKIIRISAIVIAAILTAGTLASCGSSGFNPNSDITVISREDGSGTRGAFIELFGIEQKNEDGSKTDRTIASSDINDSTGIMLTNVSQNTGAIGYVSLGALNSDVKALKIDNVDATVENIKNGTYAMSRPFNIAIGSSVSAPAQDFINFILSPDGQKVVEDNGYIAVESSEYSGTKPSGKIVIAGSSSVTPIMEKLREAYLLINTNAQIEIQQSDSTTGANSTIEGICDIGMASRELKDSELEKGLTSLKIAIDGIAVIVNSENTSDSLNKEQVMKIYTGEFTKWSDVTK